MGLCCFWSFSLGSWPVLLLPWPHFRVHCFCGCVSVARIRPGMPDLPVGPSVVNSTFLRARYCGGPHISFPFFGGGSLWILASGVPSRPNLSSGAVKSTLSGPPGRVFDLKCACCGHVRRCKLNVFESMLMTFERLMSQCRASKRSSAFFVTCCHMTCT